MNRKLGVALLAGTLALTGCGDDRSEVERRSDRFQEEYDECIEDYEHGQASIDECLRITYRWQDYLDRQVEEILQ